MFQTNGQLILRLRSPPQEMIHGSKTKLSSQNSVIHGKRFVRQSYIPEFLWPRNAGFIHIWRIVFVNLRLYCNISLLNGSFREG